MRRRGEHLHLTADRRLDQAVALEPANDVQHDPASVHDEGREAFVRRLWRRGAARAAARSRFDAARAHGARDGRRVQEDVGSERLEQSALPGVLHALVDHRSELARDAHRAARELRAQLRVAGCLPPKVNGGVVRRNAGEEEREVQGHPSRYAGRSGLSE